jgi:hypothetical protein
MLIERGIGVVLLLFAVEPLLASCVVARFAPETAGRSLEEISERYEAPTFVLPSQALPPKERSSVSVTLFLWMGLLKSYGSRRRGDWADLRYY